MLKVFPLVSWEERKEKRDQLVLIKGLFFFFFFSQSCLCMQRFGSRSIKITAVS